MFARQENALTNSRRPTSLSRGAEFYLGHLKAALKRNMIAGRDEFQKVFQTISSRANSSKGSTGDFRAFHYMRKDAVPADVIKRLKYVGNREVPVRILNDLPDSSPVAYFYPEELMQVLIAKWIPKHWNNFFNSLLDPLRLLKAAR